MSRFIADIPRGRAAPALGRFLAWSLWLLALAAPTLQAAELRWSGRPFDLVANDMDVAELLRELAASQGTTAVIDPAIDAKISGRFTLNRDGRVARQLLSDICAGNGLTWYFDGAMLFIERASDALDALLPIQGDSAPRIRDAIDRMQLRDRRFLLHISERDGQVYVAGPKHYVETVRQVVQSIDGRHVAADRSQVRVFPLRYAWASDFVIRRAAGLPTTVPGVVSVLRGLYGGSPSKGLGEVGVASGALEMPRVTGPRQVRLPSGTSVLAPALQMPDGDGARSVEAQPRRSGANALPQFEADTRMNAVLVRDLPERLDAYGAVIASMDTRPRLVEIEVTIMDVSQDSLDRLGVDWRAHGSHVDAQTGNGSAPGLTWPGAINPRNATTPVGGVFTAAIGNELRSFLLARVSALAAQGRASFVARPKVLTLDNTEANLENKSEFYVKVPGFQDASLYTVVAGTDVRVTPLVVEDADGRGVMLNINIGDDSISSELVEDLPIVRRRSVVTQAMVAEGRSVLLAGYTTEERRKGVTGVPGLSRLPVLGHLFRHNEDTAAKVERLYLLTPRLVTSSGEVVTPVLDVPVTLPPPISSTRTAPSIASAANTPVPWAPGQGPAAGAVTP